MPSPDATLCVRAGALCAVCCANLPERERQEKGWPTGRCVTDYQAHIVHQKGAGPLVVGVSEKGQGHDLAGVRAEIELIQPPDPSRVDGGQGQQVVAPCFTLLHDDFQRVALLLDGTLHQRPKAQRGRLRTLGDLDSLDHLADGAVPTTPVGCSIAFSSRTPPDVPV